MPYDFTETITLEIPDISDRLEAFSEGEKNNNHGLIIEVAALHEGLTKNGNFYTAEELESSLDSWVSPYPRPILLNHDLHTDPLGRVMAAKMDTEEDGTPYTRLQVAITDPAAIKRVADQRYLTGSVGGKANEALCSICGANWGESSTATNLPCRHRRNRAYKEAICHFKMQGINFKEYSFVNAPSDNKSGVRAPSGDAPVAESDGWVRARVYDLNMNKEEIVEFTESETTNVLSGMKKKDSSPLYLQLKGAFLSAMATAESEQEEPEMAEEQNDDVLEVSEELSVDLANTPEVEEVAEEETPAEETETEEVVDETQEEEVAIEQSTEEEVVVDPEEKVKRPEGQAKPNTEDVDPEDSKNAPLSRAHSSQSSTEEVEEESATDTELNEQLRSLELRVSELETQNQTISEENVRLRTALKRGLAERVVDTKIALRLSDESREELLEEHITRSSRSLADTLRDLASMSPKVPDMSGFPTVEGVGVAVPMQGEEQAAPVIDVPELAEKESIDPEAFFVDVLMGRKKLVS